MRDVVVKAYEAMKKASATGVADELKRAISVHAFGRMHANLTQGNTPLTPEVVRRYAEGAEDLEPLECVEDGRDGRAGYALFRRSAAPDPDTGEERVRFLWVRVVEEDGRFRFDGRFGVEEAARGPDGAPTRFDRSLLPPELRV